MIGKDSLIPISKRTLVAFALVFAMLAAMVPSVVFAEGGSTSDNVEVSFNVLGSAVVVTGVALQQSGGGSAEGVMDPQTEYVIRVSVYDANTLDDIDKIKVTLFYSDGGTYGETPTTADNRTCAIMTWTNSTDSFAISPDADNTTWSLHEDSTHDALTLSTGDFLFRFTPSKVARETDASAKWHITAQATDDNGSTWAYNSLQNLTMNWYGEIANVSHSATFPNVEVGCDNITSSDIRARYISNGDFSQQVKATTSWTGPAELTLKTSGDPGDAQFSLLVHNNGTLDSAVQVTGVYQTIATGTYQDESGLDLTGNKLWLSLGDTGIPHGTYTGYVFFQIVTS